MKQVLLDTDVILDFLFGRKPFSDHAAVVFSLCEKKQLNGFITAVSYCNSYYILRQTATHKKVIEKLTQLFSFTNVSIMDKDVVHNALHSGFNDFEDALQYYSAVKNGIIDLIITRNLKDYKKSELPVLSPKEFVNTMKD